MTNEKSRSSERNINNKMRNIIIIVAIGLLLVAAVVNFMSQMAKYNEMKAQKELLQKRINEANDNIEELEYWIDAPMDDDYIMKFAREKLDLYRADEIVFFGDSAE